MEHFVIKPSVLLLLLCLALITRLGNCQPRGNNNCSQVSANLQACAGDFLRITVGSGQRPSPQCCNGLRSVQRIEADIGSAATFECVRNFISHLLCRTGTIIGDSLVEAGITVDIETSFGINLGFRIDVDSPCS